MHNQVNDTDFERGVSLVIAPALAQVGFELEESKSDPIWDGYFFRRGRDRVCVYYLEKDCEYNFLVSRADGKSFDKPSKAGGEWLYGTIALEQARGSSLTEAELEEMSSYLVRDSGEIAELFANQIIEIFSRWEGALGAALSPSKE